MSKLVEPHGGNGLKALLAPQTERAEELSARADGLTKVPMTSREVSDVLMLAMGAYTPLDGFMNEADWRGSCIGMKLENGVFWPIPITLSCDRELADRIHLEEEVALVDGESGEILAIMEVTDKYAPDKGLECEHVYRTTDTAHPGVQKVMGQGEVNLAGRVTCLCGRVSTRRNTPTCICAPPRRGRSFSRTAGPAWPRSRPATRCSARTNTWSRSRSR